MPTNQFGLGYRRCRPNGSILSSYNSLGLYRHNYSPSFQQVLLSLVCPAGVHAHTDKILYLAPPSQPFSGNTYHCIHPRERNPCNVQSTTNLKTPSVVKGTSLTNSLWPSYEGACAAFVVYSSIALFSSIIYLCLLFVIGFLFHLGSFTALTRCGRWCVAGLVSGFSAA